MLQSLVYTTIISLSLGAPQYGGVQPYPPVKTAPLTGSVKCRTEYATLWVSRQVPKKVCDGHSVIDNAVPAHNLVPSPVSSLPEILDARRENENNQNTLLFE